MNRERGNRASEENAAALMMGDMQPLLPSSPSTDDMAQTPPCQWWREKREKEKKRERVWGGEHTGTPLRWPPTETSCSWRVYPHHYILARSHAARHSRIMSCFKKERKKELFLLFFLLFFFFFFVLLSSPKIMCGHVAPGHGAVNIHMQIEGRTPFKRSDTNN